MEALITKIVAALVDNPNEIKVKEIAGGNTVVYEVRVAQRDVGKVIGKRGHNAQAIRTIVSAAGMKLGKHVRLEFLG